MTNLDTFLPSAPLRQYVRRFVAVRGWWPQGQRVRPVIARTDVLLSFNLAHRHEAFEYRTGAPRLLPAALIVGPQTGRRADLWLGDRWATFSIEFQPAAFQRLFHLPIAPFTDRAHDACDVIGPEIATLHARLRDTATSAAMVHPVESFLLRLAANAAAASPTVPAATAILGSRGRLSVREASLASGLSERHFGRRFTEHMGMPPKLYARVARLNYVLQLKERAPALTWAAISQEAGYFDQTHLVKDFKAMAGEAPAAYMRRGAAGDGGFLLSSPPVHA